MAKMNPLLPGKLGNPELSLSSDPRLDPRLVTLFNQGEAMDEMLEESSHKYTHLSILLRILNHFIPIINTWTLY